VPVFFGGVMRLAERKKTRADQVESTGA